MSRKRKHKKGKSGGDGQWTTTGIETSVPFTSSTTEREGAAPIAESGGHDSFKPDNKLAETGEAEREMRGKVEAEATGGAMPHEAGDGGPFPPTGKQAKSQFEESEAEQRVAKKLSESEQLSREQSRQQLSSRETYSPKGLFRRILQWLEGPSPISVPIPSNPPESFEGETVLRPSPTGGVQSSGEVPSGKISRVSGATGEGPSSVVSQVHAVLMLERVLPELEETKRQLQQQQESTQVRVRELEQERDRIVAELERSRNERSDIEGHANMLRKSVAALERQLQEERQTAERKRDEYEARIRSFEEALKDSQSPVSELRAELQESQIQSAQLESLLERARKELQTAQRELQEERESSSNRIQQLESELSRKSGASEQAVSERARIEERAGLVQKALEVMEQQLREERESSAKQIKQLETELEQLRAKSAQLETRVSTLLGELDRIKTRSRKKGAAPEKETEDSTTLTTGAAIRIAALESELATGSSPIPAEKQTATTRISRLESRWDELKSRLLPKDKEIGDLRQQTEAFREQIEQLEADLAAARRQAAKSSGEAGEEGSEGGLLSLDQEAVQTLYNQSMGKLTVLMASADIVLMSPKLDPKLKGSIEDIKSEGQSLLELIKSFTLPPESKKSE